MDGMAAGAIRDEGWFLGEYATAADAEMAGVVMCWRPGPLYYNCVR